MQRNVVHFLFSLTDLQNVHTNKVWSKQSFHQVKVKKTVRIRKSHWLIILTDIWNMLTCFVIYSQTVLILQTWCWSIANVVTLIFCIFRYVLALELTLKALFIREIKGSISNWKRLQPLGGAAEAPASIITSFCSGHRAHLYSLTES